MERMKESLKQRVSSVFEINGLDINDLQSIEQMDSLEYISTLVGLEREFEIEFPDAMLIKNMFVDMEEFYELLRFLLGNQDE